MPSPVIVLSTPRSGSSWLSRILREHPGLYVYTHNTLHTQMLYLLYPMRTFNPFGDDAIEAPARTDGLLMPARVRIAARYFHNPSPERVLVLASPTSVEFVPLLRRAFPDARYVHLKRNAVDAIASLRGFLVRNGAAGVAERYRKHRHHGRVPASRVALAHLFHSLRWASRSERGYVGTRPTGFQRAASLPSLEFLCWYYYRLEEQIADALAPVPADRVHSVRYERLVGSCEAELGSLYRFMGVDVLEEGLRHAAEGVRRDGVGRSRRAFTPAELAEIERYVADREAGGAQRVRPAGGDVRPVAARGRV